MFEVWNYEFDLKEGIDNEKSIDFDEIIGSMFLL